MTKTLRNLLIIAVAVLVVVEVGNWLLDFGITRRNGHDDIGLYIAVALSAFLISTTIWLAVTNAPAGAIAINGLATISNVLALFTGVYYNIGGQGDFNHTLSHLDAVYVALGTATTAGTGDLVAKSQTARLVQTCQMGTDFALLGIALTIAVTAIMSKR